MTEKQLRKFIKIRNLSNFQNNLQFAFDAEASGFDVKELDKATYEHREPDGISFYWWNTPFGILVERLGKMRLFKK